MQTLSLTQFLIFELGAGCNLGHLHTKCPNSLGLDRYRGLDTSRLLDDTTIIACAIKAYRDCGFTGLIGWHYYNEPTLQAERMLLLMENIKIAIPAARFVLWSNGIKRLTADRLKQFDLIRISEYRSNSFDNTLLDGRIVIEKSESTLPCLRIFVEFVIDAYGNHHPCCYDWQGKSSLGNVFKTPFCELARAWAAMQRAVGHEGMTAEAPRRCLECSTRWGRLQVFDPEIAHRINERREHPCSA